MDPISVSNLFLWSDFWGLLSLAGFLILGFYAGYRRGKKAAERQHRERLVLTALEHLLYPDE